MLLYWIPPDGTCGDFFILQVTQKVSVKLNYCLRITCYTALHKIFKGQADWCCMEVTKGSDLSSDLFPLWQNKEQQEGFTLVCEIAQGLSRASPRKVFTTNILYFSVKKGNQANGAGFWPKHAAITSRATPGTCPGLSRTTPPSRHVTQPCPLLIAP